MPTDTSTHHPDDRAVRSHGKTTSKHSESGSPSADVSGAGIVEGTADPQLAHEVDESSHSQARASRSQEIIGEQAFKDAVGPQQDMGKDAVMDEVYNRALAPDRGSPPRR